jgi:hypothetical protein
MVSWWDVQAALRSDFPSGPNLSRNRFRLEMKGSRYLFVGWVLVRGCREFGIGYRRWIGGEKCLPHDDVPETFFAGGVFGVGEEEVGVDGDCPGFAHHFGDLGLEFWSLGLILVAD